MFSQLTPDEINVLFLLVETGVLILLLVWCIMDRCNLYFRKEE